MIINLNNFPLKSTLSIHKCVKSMVELKILSYFLSFRLGTSSLTMEESLDQNPDFSDLVRR